MNNKLRKYARELNTRDSKNLSQKLVKTTEELGELARAILPFEDASGVLHRFSDKASILEEAVDVMLCTQSIIHELEFSDDEVERMISRKLNKWGGLQAAESAVVVGHIPFEIHITVSIPDSSIESFRTVCRALNIKPIVLDLQISATESMQDVMTSSVHIGSNMSAYNEMNRITEGLTRSDFKVIREKIETVPWHPAAPTKKNPLMPTLCYFESHLAVVCNDGRRSLLNDIADAQHAHLSRNVFKVLENDQYVIMITTRSHSGTIDEFKTVVSKLKDVLTQNDFDVDKEIIEFAIYDTKIDHDATWSNPNE